MTAHTPSTHDSYCSLAQVSELIRQHQLSPVVLATTCLERIEHLQPQLNAFITVISETAIEDAKTAEQEIQHGRWKGFLHGIPIGIKDFYDTAGIRTTAAFEHFKNRVPSHDAAVVEKLKEAGAIIIGKTNMHTLGRGTTGLESCFGPAKNPCNADYIPGGSSSGSAAAVASGMCYATIDTDAIGSCRLPAACCGVVGFKGTYGLINMKGILEGEQPPDETILWLSHAGITTRSCEDTALVLDVLAERRPDAKAATFFSALAPETNPRIGIAANYKTGQEVSDVFDKAAEIFRSRGFSINQASAPLFDFSQGIGNIEEDRKAIADRIFKDIDVLLLPTIPTTTPLVKDADKHPQALSSANTLFANYYGLPAISVPCGFDRHGLPLGLQIVARPYDDAAVLRLAHQYQMAMEHGSKHPIPSGQSSNQG
jgi:aspartyl-tRNA(Asn)/glutamyl-tRNA(Gln) amidotransferase subunit A